MKPDVNDVRPAYSMHIERGWGRHASAWVQRLGVNIPVHDLKKTIETQLSELTLCGPPGVGNVAVAVGHYGVMLRYGAAYRPAAIGLSRTCNRNSTGLRLPIRWPHCDTNSLCDFSLQWNKMLKIGVVRWKGRCHKHPGYAPEVDGLGGIRGGCRRCELLLSIYSHHTALVRSIREFGARPEPPRTKDPFEGRQMSFLEGEL